MGLHQQIYVVHDRQNTPTTSTCIVSTAASQSLVQHSAIGRQLLPAPGAVYRKRWAFYHLNDSREEKGGLVMGGLRHCLQNPTTLSHDKYSLYNSIKTWQASPNNQSGLVSNVTCGTLNIPSPFADMYLNPVIIYELSGTFPHNSR